MLLIRGDAVVILSEYLVVIMTGSAGPLQHMFRTGASRGMQSITYVTTQFHKIREVTKVGQPSSIMFVEEASDITASDLDLSQVITKG